MGTTNSLPATGASPAKSTATAVKDTQASGLSSEEARRRLEKAGPNAMPDTALHPLRRALRKFWAPIPWMLEAMFVLLLVLGDYAGMATVAVLLAVNAAFGLGGEGCARALKVVSRAK